MSDVQRGTNRTYLISRLRAEHPELAKRVDLGEITAYRAGCEAGIVARRFSIYADGEPDVIAKAMRRNLSPELIQAVVALLSEA